MSTNRQNLLNKIRALMAKTIDNGCTEAEAMSALSMAQTMMDAYDVTEADLQEAKTESAIHDTMKDMRDPHHIRQMLTVAISEFTGTKVWTSHNKKKLNFAGLPSDIEFAMWLTETLTMFVQKELKNYIWGNDYTSLPPNQKRPIIMGFVIGCTRRINERLRELIKASEAQSSGNANALVIIKNDLINKKMAELGVALRTPRARGSRIQGDAYGAGKASGDKASFGRPVGGGGVKMIGGW